MPETISVLICTYNYGRFLPHCLSSVLDQSRVPDEVIVVDDGSTDDTSEVVKRFPGVRYVYQENAGKASAMSRAVALSTGDILCHLDADDYWLPNKIERVCEELERRPSIGGVIHEVRHVDEWARAVNLRCAASKFPEPVVLTLDSAEETGFLYPLPAAPGSLPGNPNTVCARRSSLADLFPVPPATGLCVDAVFLAGALRFGLSYIPEVLSSYRHHGKNHWLGNTRAQQDILDMLQFLLSSRNFCRHLSSRHESFLRAKILERKAFVASRTGKRKLEGLASGLKLPFLVARNGRIVNWRHLSLPVLCIVPLKRARHAKGGANARRSVGTQIAGSNAKSTKA